ncbi:biopolymer transporter ExbD [Prevotella sp. P6B4]|uniref:ExbD/TolR family protein n=1 Tax=Prevotella sp. P6B4 TaxID=1410614 RepID=UPI001E45A31A|nr:biopolymer transporter ExbD [Prevotella sp. P6B4]
MRPMRSMFHQSRRSVPSLNVASMPDLIFTVLFFFMIVTHMRSDEVKVRLEVPQGSEVQKLTNKQAVVNLYIGHHHGAWGVQLNGDLVQPADIPALIEHIRGGLSNENQQRLTVNLRVDRKAPMGLVAEVKRQLQQAYALKINYSATELNK